MNKETFLRYILDRREIQAKRSFIPRDLRLDHAFLAQTGKIAALVGLRRSGKSMYLLQVAQELDLQPEQSVWLDFSDYLWQDFRVEDREGLWQACLEAGGGRLPVFFLDEIQELPEFEPWLRFLQNQGARLYLTGSNARFFAQDLAASLRGKVLTYDLHTLSFSEFLRFKGLEFPPTLSSLENARRDLLLKEYLSWGGFPEVVLADREELKRHLLESYVDTMLLRDVLDRHNVKNLALIRRIFLKALASFTKDYSVHRWYNELKSQGFKVGKDTVYEYLSYLEESLALHSVANAAQPEGSRKLFLADNGLYQLVKDRPDLGKLWENACYLQLLRRGQRPRWWRDEQGEVDFVTETALIQAVFELNEGNRLREEAPLARLAARFPEKTPKLAVFPDWP